MIKNNLNSNQTSLETILNDIACFKIDTDLKEDKVSGEKTVKVPRGLNSKYRLESSWCFWFYKNNRDYQWKENLIQLCTIKYVEDFWSVYNHLKPVEYLSEGCDYMFFKKGIKPMWEDLKNQNGGRWVLSLDKRSSSNLLGTLWLNSLLSLIGSRYDEENQNVNGVVLSIRFKINKLALWTDNSSNQEAQNKILNRFKKELGVNNLIITYEAHRNN